MTGCHPLIEAVLELDSAADPLLRKAGSRREQERLRDAIADMARISNEVYVNVVAQGYGELTVAVFEDVVKRAQASGLNWHDMAAAFHRAQGSES